MKMKIKRLKFLIVETIDWIDCNIIGHRWQWLCNKLVCSSWWPMRYRFEKSTETYMANDKVDYVQEKHFMTDYDAILYGFKIDANRISALPKDSNPEHVWRKP